MNSSGKLELSSYVAGRKISSAKQFAVHSPYEGRWVGSVTRAQREDTEAAIAAALSGGETLTRFQRSAILDKARQLLEERREDFARLITSESGLCLRETRYEVGRALDVLRFAAMEALRDDGQIFSGDVSPQGKARKIFTVREPLALVVAITPFNDPLIVLEDADLDLAVTLAAEGSYRNSGQRCTAVKRILVQQSVADEFTRRLVERTKEYKCGDPLDEATRVGTVIDEASAIYLETVVKEAVSAGAKVLIGGERRGALLQPTVIAEVPRDCRMIVCESFGPLAPVVVVKDLDDAIQLANSTAYGLSSGVVTNSLDKAMKAVKQLKCGTVNVNEVPGYRIESSPFGGVKDSGLGIKEGVIEAMKCMTTVKTFSLPW